MTISERIKARRIELGLTLEDVGKILNVSKSTVLRYETSEIENMGIDKLENLAKALQTTPGFLMGWFDSPTQKVKLAEDRLPDNDSEIRMIARARSNMSEQDREKMMKILRASFDEYFDDNND